MARSTVTAVVCTVCVLLIAGYAVLIAAATR
jgi:hypothetical protein